MYSNSANSHPGGFKVHGETMLDWLACKNISIPGYTNNAFDDFNKLYYSHSANRLEIITDSGIILGSSAFTAIGGANLNDQEESNEHSHDFSCRRTTIEQSSNTC